MVQECLALVPPSVVETQFELLKCQMRYALSRHIDVRSKGKEFIDYFIKTYLEEGVRFPKSMWNHWDNHDERTNNRVEGDNNKMKNFCGATDPNIDKASGLLQKYELEARDKYLNAKLKNARAPSQKPDVAMREGNFRLYRRLHRKGELTFQQYLAHILDLNKFEPKKKIC